MKSPIVGRLVRVLSNVTLRPVLQGFVIDSFWAPEFYRVVIEIVERYDGGWMESDGSHRIAIIPLGNSPHAFEVYVLPETKNGAREEALTSEITKR